MLPHLKCHQLTVKIELFTIYTKRLQKSEIFIFFLYFLNFKFKKQEMQREEKQLESLIDAVINRLNDLKHSIGAMILKIETEYETINWPTFLDNFALISSHVSCI